MISHSKSERISVEPGDPDGWVCICGNMPSERGFYPCNAGGMEIEPSIGSNWNGYHVCAKCGRIIDQTSLIVVGMA